MNINEMTRKEIESLPYLKKEEIITLDSIVLIPSRSHHDSGFNYFEVVPCYDMKPLGKLLGYDTFSIIMDSVWNRVGIDCLRGSSLMRIFLPDDYEIHTCFHEARKKGD